MNTPGTLYIVSTPIGNLEDITLRALRILKEVDLIAAEDTRHTRKLLAFYDIHTPLTSYFDQNEAHKTPYLIQHLQSGKSVALVSDAGTPGISDPGYQVIVAAITHQLPLVPIPGPSAMLAAIIVSGFPLDKFVFLGFLTNKRSTRLQQLQAMRAETKTMVCYVSPHQFVNTLQDMQAVLGDRPIVVTRELTKTFEEVVRGTIGEVWANFQARPAIKGEFTVVIAGGQQTEPMVIESPTVLDALRKYLTEDGLSHKDAVKAVAKEFGLSKNRVYQESLALLKEGTL